MSDDKETAFAAVVGMLAGPWIVAGLLAFLVAGIAYETWVAMTIWGWFSPWTLPFTLVQAIGMNVAISLIVRQVKPKDDREGAALLGVAVSFYFLAPTLALGTMWCLRWVMA